MTTAAGTRATSAPLMSQSRPDVVGIRVIAAAILVGSLAILGIGTWLTPSTTGTGTHEELGLLPCGFLALTGYPCATCGMTTAVTHAVHGNLLTAFYVQPAGALLAIATAVAAILALYSLIGGVSLMPVWRVIWRPRVILASAAVVLVAWVYKTLLVRGVI